MAPEKSSTPSQNPHSAVSTESIASVDVIAGTYGSLAREERAEIERSLREQTKDRKAEVATKSREARQDLLAEGAEGKSEQTPATSPETESPESTSPRVKQQVQNKTEKAAPENTEPTKTGLIGKAKDTLKKIFNDIKIFFTGLIGGKVSNFISKIIDRFKGKKGEKTDPTASAPKPNSPREEVASSSSNWRDVAIEQAKKLQIDPAFALAVIEVEAGQKGLNSDGTPVIRFEPHVFNAQLKKQGIDQRHGSWGNDKIHDRKVDGVSCEGGQGNEHACLQRALEINKDAAYNSISMGLPQIMGFNSRISGYSNAENMYQKFSANGGGEPEQIRAMFTLISKNRVQLAAARNKDFGKFTQAYNGSKPGSNLYARYTAKLGSAYNKYKSQGVGNNAVA